MRNGLHAYSSALPTYLIQVEPPQRLRLWQTLLVTLMHTLCQWFHIDFYSQICLPNTIRNTDELTHDTCTPDPYLSCMHPKAIYFDLQQSRCLLCCLCGGSDGLPLLHIVYIQGLSSKVFMSYAFHQLGPFSLASTFSLPGLSFGMTICFDVTESSTMSCLCDVFWESELFSPAVPSRPGL